MYELIQVAEKSYFFQCPAKIGLYKINETDVCLIDSGNDKEAGKKVLKVIRSNGWNLTSIFNTHSHADHIGGNAYLQAQTGCKIFAPSIESDFTCHPILESCYLYGGFSPSDLRHKFLMAKESLADKLTEEALPEGLEIIQLPGHSFDMVGFRTSDNVIYLADCISSKETIDKYQINFLYDVKSYLETLEKIQTLKADLFIPAHAEPTPEIAPLARVNIEKSLEIGDKLLEICQTPLSFDQLLQRLFSSFQLKMTFEQHALVGSTVRSYLSWLKDQKKIDILIEDHILYWKTV